MREWARIHTYVVVVDNRATVRGAGSLPNETLPPDCFKAICQPAVEVFCVLKPSSGELINFVGLERSGGQLTEARRTWPSNASTWPSNASTPLSGSRERRERSFMSRSSLPGGRTDLFFNASPFGLTFSWYACWINAVS